MAKKSFLRRRDPAVSSQIVEKMASSIIPKPAVFQQIEAEEADKIQELRKLVEAEKLRADSLYSQLQDLQSGKQVKISTEVVYQIKEWEGKSVMICTPWYRQTNPATAICIGALLAEYGMSKIGWQWNFGDAMIYHSRNTVADKFLATQAEWSLWIDDDIVFPIGRSSILREFCSLGADYPENLLATHALSDLLSAGKTLVGGLYYGRNINGLPMFAEGVDDAKLRQKVKSPDFNQVLPTRWVATGFMLVHRSVFESIKDAYPDLSPGKKEIGGGLAIESKHWDFFLPLPGRGEDVSFCERALKSGHQPHVHTGVRCFHVGYNPWNWHNTKQ